TGDADTSADSGSVNVDFTAPTETCGSIDISADTGTADDDFNTKTAAQTITCTLTGALDGTDVLYITVDAGSNWAVATSSVSGTAVSVASQTLSGSSSINFKVADATGNELASSAQSYTLDTTAPTITYTGAIEISADTGTADDDFNTKTAAQTLTATLSAAIASDDTLQVSVNNGGAWTDDDHNTAAGTALSTSMTLVAGGAEFHIRIKDNAGNAGTASETAYTLDTTAPTITYSSVDISADTGSAADDFITKTAAQTLTATLSAAIAADDILQVSINAGSSWTNDDHNTAAGTALSTAIVLTDDTTSAIHIRITDDAGNSGTATTQAYTHDDTVPTLTIAIASNNAVTTQAKSGDIVTLTMTPSQTLQGNPACTIDGEAGTAGADGSDHTCTLTLSGDETAGNLAFSVTGGGTFADVAGNNGATDTSANSGSVNVDFTAPTVTISGIGISADTGTASDDFETATAAQTLTATLSAAAAGSDIVYVSVDAGSSWTDKTSDVSGTALSTSITLTDDTTSAIHIKVTDAAGNDGTAGTQAYTHDDTAPTISFSSVDISADTGTANDDFNTKTAAQTLTATLSAAIASDDILQVSVNNGGAWTNDDHNTAAGTSLSTAMTLVAGGAEFHIRITDDAGNSGTASET
ncbi:uncharacterized protein METZ01_LOCUS179656, partial [marine metagenome]